MALRRQSVEGTVTDYSKAVGNQSHLSQGLFFKPSEKKCSKAYLVSGNWKKTALESEEVWGVKRDLLMSEYGIFSFFFLSKSWIEEEELKKKCEKEREYGRGTSECQQIRGGGNVFNVFSHLKNEVSTSVRLNLLHKTTVTHKNGKEYVLQWWFHSGLWY